MGGEWCVMLPVKAFRVRGDIEHRGYRGNKEQRGYHTSQRGLLSLKVCRSETDLDFCKCTSDWGHEKYDPRLKRLWKAQRLMPWAHMHTLFSLHFLCCFFVFLFCQVWASFKQRTGFVNRPGQVSIFRLIENSKPNKHNLQHIAGLTVITINPNPTFWYKVQRIDDQWFCLSQ